MPLLQTRQVSASAVPVAPCLRIRKAAVADDGGSPEKRTSGGWNPLLPCVGRNCDLP
jgi:hypothetical protein